MGEPNAWMQRDMSSRYKYELKDPNVCFIGSEVERHDLSLSLLRQMCDVFVRPRGIQFGGSMTLLEDMYQESHGEVVKLALDAFNSAKWTNYKLVKLMKINMISVIFHCPTFEAKEEGSDKSFTFRAVVNVTLDEVVLLCEIKDGKDSGKGIVDFVIPGSHYFCFEHERGECYDGNGVTCANAVGPSRGSD